MGKAKVNESGIYEIVNLISGNRYIGSAVDFDSRWSVHRSSLRRGVHRSKVLQRAWDKHGERAFAFRRLVLCAPQDLLDYEQRFIDALGPRYNQYKVAGSPLGTKWTDEQRARLREVRASQPKRTISAETRAKINAALAGRKLSAEHKAKIGAALRGRKASPDSVAKRVEAMKGRERSAEHRAALSAAHKGKTMPAETRQKISEALKGRAKPQGFGERVSATKRAQSVARKGMSVGSAQA